MIYFSAIKRFIRHSSYSSRVHRVKKLKAIYTVFLNTPEKLEYSLGFFCKKANYFPPDRDVLKVVGDIFFALNKGFPPVILIHNWLYSHIPLLMDLYRLFIYFGKFVYAYEIRCQINKLIILKTDVFNCSEAEWYRYCSACIESGDLNNILQFVDCRPQTDSMENKEYLKWFVNLIIKNNKESFHSFSGNDAEFNSRVYGLNIAVVGPAVSDAECSEEIDSRDVVVRMNFKGSEFIPNNKGRRVDISYYSVAHAKKIGFYEKNKSFENLFSVFVKKKAFRVLGDHFRYSRLVRNLSWLLGEDEFNIGLNAVYDLLSFQPRSIYVYFMDLMLSKGREKGYWFNTMGGTDTHFTFVSRHDPIVQYSFFNILYLNGFVTGDKVFREVMDLGVKGYMEGLEETYG